MLGGRARLFALCAGLAALSVTLALPARAQPATGTIQGRVTTQQGAVALVGATLEITAANAPPVDLQTDASGQFRVDQLAPGPYRVRVSLDGFRPIDTTLAVPPGGTVTRTFDLAISSSETITVRARAEQVAPASDVAAPAAAADSRTIDQFVPSGSFQDAMRLFASVIPVPRGLSIKGGRPEQTSVQLGHRSIVEPSTGLAPLVMPADAIDSVAVLPNPYDVEYGRFSSGIVVINTRRAEDKWRFRLNDLDPDLRTKRSNNLSVNGIRSFTPRLSIGGPLKRDKIFLEQALQYSYGENDVASLPENQVIVNRWISSFTRMDLNAGAKHSFTLAGGIFDNHTDDATLGTFTPPEASVNVARTLRHASVVARSTWNSRWMSESTASVQSYELESQPHGDATMVLRPDTTLGNFFNRADRDTATYQFTHTLTTTRGGGQAIHLLKFGIDLLANTYAGASISSPVLVDRPDGTLARRLDWAGPTSQHVNSLDAAIFAEDQVQLGGRWVIEWGARVDRDGVLGRATVEPRGGIAVTLNSARTITLRAGVGMFTERTPSAAGAFEQFQSAIDTRYAADGQTAAGDPTRYANVAAPGLRPARSTAWSANLEHRVNATWAWHTAILDRRGTRELIVTPVLGDGTAEMLLSSDGRSTYRDIESGVHFTHAPGFDIEATYTRSYARENLNAFTALFGVTRAPIVGADAYAPAAADAPNRLFVRGRLSTARWLVLGVFDWRTGFPYSIVDAALDFVGPRNSARMPAAKGLELGLERRVRIGSAAPWLGVRINNPFNTFSPADVQANISAPDFGALYNSAYRRFRIIIRFER